MESRDFIIKNGTLVGYYGCDDEVVIPSEVDTLGFQCFYACKASSIEIPENVKKIEKRAFWRCENLEELYIPESVGEIDEFAFADCKSLKSISIENTSLAIYPSIFEGCISLESITVPEMFYGFPVNMLIDCPKLQNIKLVSAEGSSYSGLFIPTIPENNEADDRAEMIAQKNGYDEQKKIALYLYDRDDINDIRDCVSSYMAVCVGYTCTAEEGYKIAYPMSQIDYKNQALEIQCRKLHPTELVVNDGEIAGIVTSYHCEQFVSNTYDRQETVFIPLNGSGVVYEGKTYDGFSYQEHRAVFVVRPSDFEREFSEKYFTLSPVKLRDIYGESIDFSDIHQVEYFDYPKYKG